MNIFEELELYYSEINKTYVWVIENAEANNDFIKETGYNRRKQLNDDAYFLFMFTKLEDIVRLLSDNLINSKLENLNDWQEKRAWEILHKRKDRIAFMDRVALLTKLNGSDFQLIEKYFKQRNNIAHGGTFTIPISIADAFINMNRICNSFYI